MSSSRSNAKPKPPVNGSWSVNAGLATWSAATATPNTSYNLTVPTQALRFSVTTPSTRTKEFSLRSTLSQLGSTGNTSTFKGSAAAKDKFRITDASGVVTDDLFVNFSSVEELSLQGSGGFNVTLGVNAQAAGFREVEGGAGNDKIDASAFTSGLEIEGESGIDSLTGGQGNDKIEGGKGADQIDLSAGGSDRVIYESRLDGSSVGVAGQAFSGFDQITGFSAANDKIDIDYSVAAVEFITEAPGFVFTNVDAVVTAMNAAVAADLLVAGRNVVFAINDGTTSALYSATVIDTDAVQAGVQAGVASPTMLATVDAVLASGTII